MRRAILSLLVILAIVTGGLAASWSGYVKTNSDIWSIHRESHNMSLYVSSSVNGNISPLEFRGRVLNPYHSYYADVDVNDIRMKERTGAMEGSFSSKDLIRLRSSVTDLVYLNVTKPSGTPVYYIRFVEKWPVVLMANKTIDYSGQNINDREFMGNNLDYIGTTTLYNTEFSKEQGLYASLRRMNATILATDDEIIYSDLQPTKYTDYRLATHTTGIIDLSYDQKGFTPDKMGKIETKIEGNERYTGIYDINRHIEMGSLYTNTSRPEDWLPCCSGGWDYMRPTDKKGFGSSANGIFDCTCFKVLPEAQFPR